MIAQQGVNDLDTPCCNCSVSSCSSLFECGEAPVFSFHLKCCDTLEHSADDPFLREIFRRCKIIHRKIGRDDAGLSASQPSVNQIEFDLVHVIGSALASEIVNDEKSD